MGSGRLLRAQGMKFESAVLEAEDDFGPLAKSVVDGFGGIAAGKVLVAGLGEEEVELVGNGAAVGAPDEFAAGCGAPVWRVCFSMW